jgi:hypothetical protein
MAVADFVDEKRREMEGRLKELRPLVDEFHRLEAAVLALQGVASQGEGSAPRSRRPASRPRPEGGGGRGRPRGSGTRGKEALELVTSRPGISIPELAEEMGIAQNYLYRVLPGLQKDGLVRKEGRGWHPMESSG